MSRSGKALQAEAPDTRLALICAAERLFAEQGLQKTSLRQINQEAGQRNESAIHYHFGSREAVIAAIIELRTRPVNEDRLQMLADARAKAGDAPLSSVAIAEILVLPLVRALAANPGENHYLRFLTQLSLDRASRQRVSGGPYDTSVVQCLNEFIRSKPYFPRQVQHQRFVAASLVMNRMLAILEEISQAKRGRSSTVLDGQVRVANIIDMVVGLLDAPISPHALVALAALEKAES
jgi:AcrR family transcriptional regulator